MVRRASRCACRDPGALALPQQWRPMTPIAQADIMEDRVVPRSLNGVLGRGEGGQCVCGLGVAQPATGRRSMVTSIWGPCQNTTSVKLRSIEAPYSHLLPLSSSSQASRSVPSRWCPSSQHRPSAHARQSVSITRSRLWRAQTQTHRWFNGRRSEKTDQRDLRHFSHARIIGSSNPTLRMGRIDLHPPIARRCSHGCTASSRFS
ncbi:hypothetical protein N7510_002528 [Penicillium lagena]|uniref:uncharacterized protein n=1 Tax=Penicillium lagena TaxID=94218 RepID=UPI002541FF89|nr:uncharacterized protein N7510_002528 [Penicillium lagena]KAJ5626219.1 hypothetical protein N7510_002528 [Penicillium lagena]